MGDFTGKVVEVHSGDSLTVEKDADFSLVKIFLASIKAPKLTQDVQENYGWESKESLRKFAIGKKVKVVIEYSKMIPTKKGDELQMNFGTVFAT
jgi:endonuclease YncB( thermonuclease family)